MHTCHLACRVSCREHTATTASIMAYAYMYPDDELHIYIYIKSNKRHRICSVRSRSRVCQIHHQSSGW